MADRDSIERRIEEIDSQLADPDTLRNPQLIRSLQEERSNLAGLADTMDEISRTESQIAEMEEVLEDEDPELASIAREELPQLRREHESLQTRLRKLLIPPDPNDRRNVIVEIRAGTGGEEAALFAADVYSMYASYAQSRGWKLENLSSRPSERGGFKEVVFSLQGKRVYSRMKFEAGVHRVQRVPETETQGRIHTSACSVAVLPEAEEVEVKINDEDLRVDVYRSSGPGGQSVNTTDSAVRITHAPTGIVVACQDEKSQHKNKSKAMKVLRSRLLDHHKREQDRKRASARKSMIGSGDRSAKIRTYNFPQNRVTDHRINLTTHNLDQVMGGELDPVIDALTEAEEQRLLSELSEEGGPEEQ
ncbi:peptide chain release factor 1 [Candidatus Fermentibacteria bacterium]|nr:peptide chain release factor 1 [Candidatus Fermentibacteria bacterium]